MTTARSEQRTNPFLGDVVGGPDDYRPEWDVAGLFGPATHAIDAAVQGAADGDRPDADNRIHLVLAEPGAGKSHLMGRLKHRLQGRAEVVYLQSYGDEMDGDGQPDLPRLLRRRVTEALFRSREPNGGFQPVTRLLAQRTGPSFGYVLGQAPQSVRQRHATLRRQLKRDPSSCERLVAGCRQRQAFRTFAESFANAHLGQVRIDVMHALALGWSPDADTARAWLLGERPDAADCGLGDEPPGMPDVLRGATTLTGRRPVLLMFDQIDGLIRQAATRDRLLDLLMNELLVVPDLIPVVNCFPDSHDEFLRAQVSFLDRCRTHRLDGSDKADPALDAGLNVEIVRRRLATWGGHRAEEPFWPFDEDDLRRFSAQSRARPRTLIRQCRERFDAWQSQERPEEGVRLCGAPATGRRATDAEAGPASGREVAVPGSNAAAEKSRVADKPVADDGSSDLQARRDRFRQLWEEESQTVRDDETRQPDRLSTDRLHGEIVDLLRLFENAERLPLATAGLRLRKVNRRHPLRRAADTDTAHSLTVRAVAAADGERSEGVVVGLSHLRSGHDLRKLIDRIDEFLDRRDDAWGVLMHTAATLPKGAKKSLEKVERLERAGRLQVVALADCEADMHRLEAYAALLERAGNRDLELEEGVTVDDVRDCQDLAAANRDLLADGPLLRQMLAGPGKAPSGPAQEGADESAPVVPRTASAERPAVPEAPDERPPAPADGKPAGASRARSSANDDRLAPPADGRDAPQAVAAATRPRAEVAVGADEAQEWADGRLAALVAVLDNLRIEVEADSAALGPRFARMSIVPHGRTSVAKVRGRAEDLKVRLGLSKSPVVDSQAGAISVDLELPPELTRTVLLEQVGPPPTGGGFCFPLGQDVGGTTHWLDLADPNSCHMLVAGATGSGKSEFLKALIGYLAGAHPPEEVQFLLVDPKRVTFNLPDADARDCPHMRFPVARDAQAAVRLVDWCVEEMERRYRAMEQARVDNIDRLRLRRRDSSTWPRLVAVFDEFANLMADEETREPLESGLKQLSSKARAAGIHLVLATQRPEASVVKPLIRSNLPAKVCLAVASKAESRLVLDDESGSDLLGKGDLLARLGGRLVRLQSPYLPGDGFERSLGIIPA